MDQFDQLERQIADIIEREAVSLAELRNLLLEIDEFINSDPYHALSIEERSRDRKSVV